MRYVFLDCQQLSIDYWELIIVRESYLSTGLLEMCRLIRSPLDNDVLVEESARLLSVSLVGVGMGEGLQ